MSAIHKGVDDIVSKLAEKHELTFSSLMLPSIEEEKFIRFTLGFLTKDVYRFTLTHTPNYEEDYTNICIIDPDLDTKNRNSLIHVRALISRINMFYADLEKEIPKLDVAFRLADE